MRPALTTGRAGSYGRTMRRRLVPFLAGALLVAVAVTPASADRPVARRVAPGYDLFFTPDGSEVAVNLVAARHTLMTFRGRPLGSFDFGRRGVLRTGTADTIVHRLDTATPASPRVRIELVGLLLESTNMPGYFVTLQSARPLGLPSTGTLEFTFDDAGVGGLLRSELLVNYDVRYGAPDGPIVATGSTGLGFVAENVLWTRADDGEDGADICVTSLRVCVDTSILCHDAGGTIPHKHCNEGDADGLPLIAGVNHLLNGVDTSSDFHPRGTASPPEAR